MELFGFLRKKDPKFNEIRIGGVVDHGDDTELREELQRAYDAGAPHPIIVNVASLRDASAKGLRPLEDMARTCKENGRPIALVGADDRLHTKLDIKDVNEGLLPRFNSNRSAFGRLIQRKSS